MTRVADAAALARAFEAALADAPAQKSAGQRAREFVAGKPRRRAGDSPGRPVSAAGRPVRPGGHAVNPLLLPLRTDRQEASGPLRLGQTAAAPAGGARHLGRQPDVWRNGQDPVRGVPRAPPALRRFPARHPFARLRPPLARRRRRVPRGGPARAAGDRGRRARGPRAAPARRRGRGRRTPRLGRPRGRPAGRQSLSLGRRLPAPRPGEGRQPAAARRQRSLRRRKAASRRAPARAALRDRTRRRHRLHARRAGRTRRTRRGPGRAAPPRGADLPRLDPARRPARRDRIARGRSGGRTAPLCRRFRRRAAIAICRGACRARPLPRRDFRVRRPPPLHGRRLEAHPASRRPDRRRDARHDREGRGQAGRPNVAPARDGAARGRDFRVQFLSLAAPASWESGRVEILRNRGRGPDGGPHVGRSARSPGARPCAIASSTQLFPLRSVSCGCCRRGAPRGSAAPSPASSSASPGRAGGFSSRTSSRLSPRSRPARSPRSRGGASRPSAPRSWTSSRRRICRGRTFSTARP